MILFFSDKLAWILESKSESISELKETLAFEEYTALRNTLL